MIKAIIFDCFGVLASDGWLPFRNAHFSDNPALLEEATALNKRVDAGFVKYDDFVKQVANMAGVSEEAARNDIENNAPDDALFHYIEDELKPSYKIGMLSNAGENWLDEIFKPGQVALFDATVLSYEIGTIKPDPVTYQTIASRLGVEVTECLFIDDQPKYCEGADQLGMKAIHYTGLNDLKQQLN